MRYCRCHFLLFHRAVAYNYYLVKACLLFFHCDMEVGFSTYFNELVLIPYTCNGDRRGRCRYVIFKITLCIGNGTVGSSRYYHNSTYDRLIVCVDNSSCNCFLCGLRNSRKTGFRGVGLHGKCRQAHRSYA